MKRLIIFFIPCMMILIGCQSDGGEKSVEEMQAMITDNPAERGTSKNTKLEANKSEVPADTVNVAKLDFPEKEFEFGIVDEGDKVNHTFVFKNTGKVPLTITNARGSCGCTVPDWPKEPIAVGDSGEIKVVFNTKGKRNKQTKTVTLTSNTYPVNTVLTLKGEVTPDPKAAAEAKKKAEELKKEAKAHDPNDGGDHSGHDH
jgi:hypothetical protein